MRAHRGRQRVRRAAQEATRWHQALEYGRSSRAVALLRATGTTRDRERGDYLARYLAEAAYNRRPDLRLWRRICEAESLARSGLQYGPCAECGTCTSERHGMHYTLAGPICESCRLTPGQNGRTIGV